jgi:hypothetical protein
MQTLGPFRARVAATPHMQQRKPRLGFSACLMAKYSYHQLDANHQAIRHGLLQRGVSVVSGGPLDLIWGWRGVTGLIEVKTAKGKLRPSQVAFLERWKGKVDVVRSLEEACQVVGVTF